MADPVAVAAAVCAGASLALGIVLCGPSQPGAGLWPRPRQSSRAVPPALPALDRARRWAGDGLRLRLDRAGIGDSPGKVVGSVAVAGACAGLAAGLVGSLIGAPAGGSAAVVALAGVPGLSFLALERRVRSRRRRLSAQLGPVLELLSLELSAGAAPGPGLAAVLRRLDGELSDELQRALAATPGPGNVSLDRRLIGLGDHLQIPALLSLAGIFATSREYGSSLSPGVRALAAELRRTRRRDVIASSRRALNRVLVPSAVGVLGPFMAILLYPAITTLARSLG